MLKFTKSTIQQSVSQSKKSRKIVPIMWKKELIKTDLELIFLDKGIKKVRTAKNIKAVIILYSVHSTWKEFFKKTPIELLDRKLN